MMHLEKNSFKRWESVRERQFYCGEMSFSFIYELAKWNFYVETERKHSVYLCA